MRLRITPSLHAPEGYVIVNNMTRPPSLIYHGEPFGDLFVRCGMDEIDTPCCTMPCRFIGTEANHAD